MAITDSEKLDTVWKRVIGGLSKTASALTKFLSNETIPSSAPVLPSQVWKNGDSIPTSPPGSDTSDIALYVGATALKMTNDATSPANIAWLACSSFGDASTRLKSFVPFSFGSGYSVKVYIGNPDTGPAARIFPDTSGEEWLFDYNAGVLIFMTAVPANKAATVGSGTVSVAADGIYIEVYQYIGPTGVGGDSGDLGTISTQDADDVNISGGTISNVTLTNVTIDGGTF